MEPNNPFSRQVRLLVSLLPQVAKQECFALKGGTALNLFVRDMPRLSVDIDLAYLPVQDRDTSLAAIDQALEKIRAAIEKAVPGCAGRAQRLKGTDKRIKLLVTQAEVTVKIEVTPVLRGSVYPSQAREVADRVRSEFGYAKIQLLSFEDLYAGKLCAALDRQHPRDLFDVRILLANEGISPRLKDAFLVYLLGHNRPMVELLAPVMQNIQPAYAAEFAGMALEPVKLEELEEARRQLVGQIRRMLTDEDKHFLLAVKRDDADWSRFALPEAERLPAVQWKLHNLKRMDKTKRRQAILKLERVLFG
ncbi:nucleotidyl transferase AbiEii/AbiGii toxin family protein [Gloeobacter violaceus]|uniref:Glr4338 protein n=1 Tax=Gloeobacter violaceus (strain ATCC 29082 / PCC 7421) TaxID=251221 RepID=Q7ND98_GLOVI|nr:nucleotidyl transferase AbiEii/AbiGii toxin family protein [Gloeobacter violaceus]BAC92279.1 glr4338 [Gloeobacter violaceus PCC 7421]